MITGGLIIGAKLAVLSALTVCPRSSIVPDVHFEVTTLPAVVREAAPGYLSETRVGRWANSIDIEPHPAFRKFPLGGTNLTCLYYSQFTIKLTVQPIVYVSSKYSAGSCAYTSIARYFEAQMNAARVNFDDYKSYFTGPMTAKLQRVDLGTPLLPTELTAKEHELDSVFKDIAQEAGPQFSDALQKKYNETSPKENIIGPDCH